jgi:hypothetical protein
LRKEIIVVKLVCDLCKKDCETSTLVFDKYDICDTCKTDLIAVLETVKDEVAVEKPKRGRKKKEEEPLAVEGKIEANHSNVLPVIVQANLDMRQPQDGLRVEKALMELEGVECETKEELEELFTEKINSEPVYFLNIAPDVATLQGLLAGKGFDFSLDKHRMEASDIKHELLNNRVEMSQLSAWVNENVPSKLIDHDEAF